MENGEPNRNSDERRNLGAAETKKKRRRRDQECCDTPLFRTGFLLFCSQKKLKLIASSFYSVVLSILACIKCEHIKEVKMSTDSFTLLSFVCLLSSFGSCQQDDSSVHENLKILKRVVSWMLFCILKFQFAILSKFTFVKNGVYSGDTR